MNNNLAKNYTFWTLLKFSLPTTVMMLFMSLYSIVDGVFVSRLIGTSALSAVNIVYPMISVIYALGIMLATGGSAVVAWKMGKGKNQEAREDFTMIVLAGCLAGALLTGIGFLFLKPILIGLGANETIYALCREYAATLLWFAVPAILQMLFQTFFVTAGKPGIGLAVTVFGGVANIILDYLFIAVFRWGIAGAAAATGIGFSIPAVFGFVWFLLARKGVLYFAPPKFRGKILLRTITNGSSEMVTNLSAAVITFLFNIIMMQMAGEDGVAAITIVLYAEYMLIAVYLGFSTGTAPVISYNYGKGDVGQLKKLFRISMLFLCGFSVVTFFGAIVLAKPVVGVFAPQATAVYDMAVHGFYLYSLSYIFKGINIYASALFTALGDGKTSAILSFLRTLVFIVLGMLLLPKALSMDGVWLAVPFAELLSVLLSGYYFRKLFKTQWNEEIEIRPVGLFNRRKVLALQTKKGQEHFIESPADCLREAAEDKNWHPVAIYIRGELVGFSMYGKFTEPDERVWLDRLLIDRRHQNKGYGTKTIQAMVQRLQKEYRCDKIYLSVFDENEGARKLYEKQGFCATGEIDHAGEKIMLLQLPQK